MEKQYRLWSEDETRRLQDLATELPFSELVKHFDRSPAAVNCKLKRDKIERRGEFWSKEEEQKLYSLTPKLPFKELVKYFNRSPCAINSKLKRDKIERYRNVELWSEDDVILLEDMAGFSPPEEIARKLKRTVESVRKKAAALGIDLSTRYNNFTIAKLADYSGIGRRSIDRWVREGLLAIGEEGRYSCRRVSCDDWRDFANNYPKKVARVEPKTNAWLCGEAFTGDYDHHWKDWEVARLRELAGVTDACMIAERLGKVESSVHYKAGQIGVSLKLIGSNNDIPSLNPGVKDYVKVSKLAS